MERDGEGARAPESAQAGEGEPSSPERPARGRFWRPLIALVVIAVVVASVAISLYGAGERFGVSLARAPLVGIVYIEGPIAGGRSSSSILGSVQGADDIISYLRDAREDERIKAVVLRLNTPGGTAAGAQEIWREIGKLKSAGKKVVASVADMAASGGYYIASASDYIMANPGSIVGSIGAIVQLTNLEELYSKLGVKYEVIKSGPHKDMGSAARPMTEEEREMFQRLVDDTYGQFVDAVCSGRNLPKEEVLKVADGRILLASQAKDVGLVDDFGNFEDAVDKAAELAGIEDTYQVYEYGVPTWLERLLRYVPTEALRFLRGVGGPSGDQPVGAGGLAPGVSGIHRIARNTWELWYLVPHLVTGGH